MHSYLMIYLLLWQSVWKFPDIQNIVIQQNSPPLPPNYPQTQNPFPSCQYDYGLEPVQLICAKNQNSSQNTGQRLILQLLWGCYKLVKRLWRGRKQYFLTIYREGDQLLRISGEICWKCVTDCKWVQRGVDWGCWKFKGFVPPLVPKIDRTGAKEYSKLYSLSSISGKFTGTYSKRRTRETKERDQWRDFATLQSFGIQVERHCRTSSHFMLDPVATGRRAWYQWGNWLYNYRKYRSWW